MIVACCLAVVILTVEFEALALSDLASWKLNSKARSLG